jgi:YidC/Oxa1 family membrane protein insertase
MDTKRLIIGMVLAMVIVFGWQIAMVFLAERFGWDITAERPAAPEPEVVEPAPPRPDVTAERPQVPPVEPAVEPATRPVAPPAAVPAAPTALRVQPPEVVPRAVQLGSAEPNNPLYRMMLNLSPTGAGIDAVLLNEFRRTAEEPDRFIYQQPYRLSPDGTRPLATRAVTIDGQSVDLSAAVWQFDEGATAAQATFYIDLIDEQGPVLRLYKHFELIPHDRRATDPEMQDPGLGYEMIISHRFANLAGRPLQVRLLFNGPTSPPKEMDGFDDRQIIAGYLEREQYVNIDHMIVTQFSDKQTSRDFTRLEGQPLVWAGASSVYFNAIIRPLPAEGESAPGYLAAVRAEALNPDSPSLDRQVALTFETLPFSIPAQAQHELPMRVFFGPKKRAVLQTPYFAAAPLAYDETLRTNIGACGTICTFDWIVTALVGMLRGFQLILRDWGLAIIGLVMVVRLVLHPVTRKSTESMYKMGKLGPELERLKKKHGDNKEELNKAMMQFYREQGFTPVLGCLPMLLQMPIWIALWQSLQNTFELRHAPFLHFAGIRLTWIDDLSRPDRLISWDPIPLFFGFQISALNILPLLLAVVFFLQFKFTPKPAAATPEQAQQQKMMQWMSLIFPVFLYGMPSGLNLYILTSTSIGILESWHIRKKIRLREEAEKTQREVVETKPTRGSKKRREPEEEKPRGLMGWLADLQARAEDVRRQGDRRGGK